MRLMGEGGYYLAVFRSATTLIKNFSEDSLRKRLGAA